MLKSSLSFQFFGHQAIVNQINTIFVPAGFHSARASVEPGGPTQRRNIFGNSKPASSEGQNLLTVPGQAPDAQPGDCAAVRKKVGGSYSRYTGPGLSRGLTIDGDLVDSSGRKINTAPVNGVPGSRAGSRVGSVGPTARK